MTLVPAVSDLKVDLTPLGPPVEMAAPIACTSPQVVHVGGGLVHPWVHLIYPVAAAKVWHAAHVTRGHALSSCAGQSCSPRGRAGRAGVCSPVVKGRGPGRNPRRPRPPLETSSSEKRVRSLRRFESLWLETPRFETLIAESPYGDVIRYEG